MLESLQSALRCSVRLNSSEKKPRFFNIRSLLAACGALCYSALAPALGLGDITLHSALNQPLNAEIALVEPGDLVEGQLSVSLATAEEFSRAGIEREFFLNDLSFSLILHGNRSAIRVVSSKPVNEPFLNFLVQVNQPNGRLLREYTLLIDPPGSPGIVPWSAFGQGAPATSPSPASLSRQVAALGPPTAVQPKSPEPADDTQSTAVAPSQESPAFTSGQLAEVKRLSASPAAPPAASLPLVAPQTEESGGPNVWVMTGLVVLSALLMLALRVRRQRHQAQVTPEPLPIQPVARESLASQMAPHVPEKADHETNSVATVQKTVAPHPACAEASVVIEGGSLYVAASAESEAKASGSPALDEFRLNLDDLSMDADRDLISPFEAAPPSLDKPAADTSPDFAPSPLQDIELLPITCTSRDER